MSSVLDLDGMATTPVRNEWYDRDRAGESGPLEGDICTPWHDNSSVDGVRQSLGEAPF